MFPVIFLTWADEKKAPYIHETVHIIAWDWNTLWIKEGLTVFLNDKLGGYPSFPNFGKDIDELARINLHFSLTLGMVGGMEYPNSQIGKKEDYSISFLALSLNSFMEE